MGCCCSVPAVAVPQSATRRATSGGVFLAVAWGRYSVDSFDEYYRATACRGFETLHVAHALASVRDSRAGRLRTAVSLREEAARGRLSSDAGKEVEASRWNRPRRSS